MNHPSKKRKATEEIKSLAVSRSAPRRQKGLQHKQPANEKDGMAADSQSIYAQCILPLDTTTIRVLHLKPGEESDEIQGHLELLGLNPDLPPEYECLSYVWGSPTFVKPATINLQQIKITKNLDDALRHIRSKTETIVVWADAICINQSDVDEKSQQVAMMAEIYRQCSKVYIWLGVPEAGSLTGNPFEFLEHWVRGKHFYDFPGFNRDRSTRRLIWKENKECNDVLNDFLQIVKSPWWTRAWTVQECLLPNDSTVMFGTWTATWDYILIAGDMKNRHGDGPTGCCKEAIKAFNPRQLLLINEWMWIPGCVQRYKHVLHGNVSLPWFHESLHAFSSRQCSNPHDKIYSLLSLATDPIYQDLKPNYRENISALYIDVFTRMVRETNGSFACFMGGGFGSSMSGLPSWVRDFSHTIAVSAVASEEHRVWYIRLYQASLAKPISVLWNEKKELHYRGTYADTVKAVGLQMTTSNSNLAKVFSQWLDLCKEVLGTSEPEILRNTFSRIVCGDVCKTLDGDSQFRRARETDFPEKQAWDRIMDGELLEAVLDMRAYGWGVNFAIWGRCFFITDSGRMGLCHPNTLPEDEVWVMRGVQVPFIIRALERANAGSASKYSLRGDCFLDGIMNGELGQKEKTRERHITIV